MACCKPLKAYPRQDQQGIKGKAQWGKIEAHRTAQRGHKGGSRRGRSLGRGAVGMSGKEGENEGEGVRGWTVAGGIVFWTP